ncbi:leucine-rich repeat domain-containing protein [Spiroplasma endosymbiont of Nebria brevicollis]|uniref:leucine-rich repeat domain-containing protein n=1 Tax=Spiroplasma endosymbiont of Nebria brevicollis TaxID=3066284 RepID=UPI00313BC107
MKNKNYNKQIKTIIKKSLKNDDETKCYLNEYISDSNLIYRIQISFSAIVHNDSKGIFIYQNDVNSVTSLDLSNADVNSFIGLNYFSNLTALNIANNNQVINLCDLMLVLNKLIVINISDNYVSDIGKIMFFTSLKELYVSNMKISEKFKYDWKSVFFSLSNVESLSKLVLSNNTNVTDLNDLSNLTNLTQLDLSYNNISDLSSLSV